MSNDDELNDSKKTFKFKTTVQEIKFRGSNNYHPKTKTTIDEQVLPQNDLDQSISDKIPLFESNEGKVKLSENLTEDIPLNFNDDKLLINKGSDKQSLNMSDIQSKIYSNENKSIKDINVPLRKFKTNDEEHENISLKQEEVIIDPTKKYIKTSNTSSKTLDEPKSIVEEISRHKFDKKTNNSKSTWGQSSFGTKGKSKHKSLKNDAILEEEEKGIYRTSTLKKPKGKPKEKVDEEGFVRTSTTKTKTNTYSNGKKEYVYNEEKLYNYGINRLSEQDYGRHELFKKMQRLQEDENIINKVLDKLEGQKYLSDTNRIRSFLMSYSNSESVNKTKQRLLQKGFLKKEVERVLEEMEESGIYTAIQDKECEEDKALTLLIRRYRIYEPEKSEKMSRFLISKGFNFDIVSKTMKTFSNGDFDSFDPY